MSSEKKTMQKQLIRVFYPTDRARIALQESKDYESRSKVDPANARVTAHLGRFLADQALKQGNDPGEARRLRGEADFLTTLGPLCFEDMPFGQKSDLKSGVVVDFDQIYNEAIKPTIESLGISPLKKPDFTRNPLGVCHVT
jgi:hypothetical protein